MGARSVLIGRQAANLFGLGPIQSRSCPLLHHGPEQLVHSCREIPPQRGDSSLQSLDVWVVVGAAHILVFDFVDSVVNHIMALEIVRSMFSHLLAHFSRHLCQTRSNRLNAVVMPNEDPANGGQGCRTRNYRFGPFNGHLLPPPAES